MKISVRDLRKEYRDADRTLTVIDNLNYEFPEGCSIAIVGRSGTGKSTLLHLIGGLDRPSAGHVLLDRTDLARLETDELAKFRGTQIGFVFQFHHLLGEFTARENVAMPLLIAGVDDGEACKRADELLGKVGLTDRLEHRPGELSGGEQQRVAIARALVTRPRVILADEPTGNLDIETAESVQRLLIGMHKELQNTLIVVTHSREIASSMDFVLEMLPGGALQPLRPTS